MASVVVSVVASASANGCGAVERRLAPAPRSGANASANASAAPTRTRGRRGRHRPRRRQNDVGTNHPEAPAAPDELGDRPARGRLAEAPGLRVPPPRGRAAGGPAAASPWSFDGAASAAAPRPAPAEPRADVEEFLELVSVGDTRSDLRGRRVEPRR